VTNPTESAGKDTGTFRLLNLSGIKRKDTKLGILSKVFFLIKQQRQPPDLYLKHLDQSNGWYMR